MIYSQIRYTADGPVAYLTLNRPEKINALSQQMMMEVTDALTRVSADPDVKVLVLKAVGKHFCAGHDLKELVEGDFRRNQAVFDACQRMMTLIHDLPQPVVAQVQGIATAAGCQLVAWCDLAIAEEGAKFATPGVKIGLFCATPMVALTRSIGRKAAMEMLLTGRNVPASEALELGLINRVVPLVQLDRETDALAAQIASASRLVLAMGKRAFYQQIDQPQNGALAHATQTMVLGTCSQDAQTGMRAFLNKKQPVWRDR